MHMWESATYLAATIQEALQPLREGQLALLVLVLEPLQAVPQPLPPQHWECSEGASVQSLHCLHPKGQNGDGQTDDESSL